MKDTIEQKAEQMALMMDDISKMLTRFVHNTESLADLTITQFKTLVMINDSGPCSVNDLAQILNIAPSTTSELIDRLFKAGLVTRERSLEDRRKINLDLSESGKKLLKEKREESKKCLINILQQLSGRERDVLFRSFNDLHKISMGIYK